MISSLFAITKIAIFFRIAKSTESYDVAGSGHNSLNLYSVDKCSYVYNILATGLMECYKNSDCPMSKPLYNKIFEKILENTKYATIHMALEKEVRNFIFCTRIENDTRLCKNIFESFENELYEFNGLIDGSKPKNETADQINYFISDYTCNTNNSIKKFVDKMHHYIESLNDNNIAKIHLYDITLFYLTRLLMAFVNYVKEFKLKNVDDLIEMNREEILIPQKEKIVSTETLLAINLQNLCNNLFSLIYINLVKREHCRALLNENSDILCLVGHLEKVSSKNGDAIKGQTYMYENERYIMTFKTSLNSLESNYKKLNQFIDFFSSNLKERSAELEKIIGVKDSNNAVKTINTWEEFVENSTFNFKT